MPPILLIGDETANYKEAAATAAKIATAFQFEAQHTGFVEELFFRTGSIANIGTTKLVLGIYAEGATTPIGKPLGFGQLEETPLASNTWLSVSGLKIFVKGGTKYWLAALVIGGTINYNTSVLTLGTPDSKSITEHETLEENTWGANLKTGPAGFYGLGTELRFTASLASLGSLSKRKIRAPLQIGGKLTYVGSLMRKTAHISQSQLAFQGVILRTIFRNLQGSIVLQNYPYQRFSLTKRLTAAASVSGILSQTTMYRLFARLESNTQFGKKIMQPLGATLIAIGIFSPKITRIIETPLRFVLSNTSGLHPRLGLYPRKNLYPHVSTISRTTIYELTSTLIPPGSLTHNPSRTFATSLSFHGFSQSRILRALTSALSFSTSLLDRDIYPLTATLMVSTQLQRNATQKLLGSLAISSILRIKALRLLNETIAFIGAINRSSSHQSNSMLSFNTGISRLSLRRIVQDTLAFLGSTHGITLAHPLPDILVLKQPESPSIVLRSTEVGNVYSLIDYLKGYPEMELQSIVAKRHILN